jgi:deoxyribonuclease V
MRVPPFPLPRNAAEAIAWQKELAGCVRAEPLAGPVRRIAGTDVAFDQASGLTHAAVVVVDASSLAPLELAGATMPTTFPYIPGLLSFREIPALLACFEQIGEPPDVILCDGQGIAHPRGAGLASHLGLVLGISTAGCAKSRLVGDHDEPPPDRGGRAELRYHGQTVGCVLRSRTGVKPLYVSVGHRVNLEDAVRLVLACARRFRLPEPQRLAHHHAALQKELTTKARRTQSSE